MLISIIIPVAKSQFLAHAIESIINQTYTDWEIIIIDDNLDPNVKQVVSGFKDLTKIRYYKPAVNLGFKDPTRTWNYGLQFACGEFGILLGDDDYLSNNYLEKMAKMVIKYQYSNIFRARLALIDSKDRVYEYGLSLPEFEHWDELMYFRNLYRRRQSTSEIMFNLSELKKIGGFISFPYAWASDDATWIRLAKNTGIYSTNEAFAFFRRHETALSGLIDTKQIKGIEAKFLEWSHQFIRENYTESDHIISKDVLEFSVDNRFNKVEELETLTLFNHIRREFKAQIKKLFLLDLL